MSNATCDRPGLGTFTRLDDLGLDVMGQGVGDDRTVLACKVVGEARRCRRCGCQGISRGTVVRRLAHEPCGWRPTILHVSVRRYRCQECSRVAPRHESSGRSACQALARGGALGADGRGRSSCDGGARRPGPGRVLEYCQHCCSGRRARLLINDPARFEGVRVIGVDEHVWRHTLYGDKYVTVILDLTHIGDRRGHSRLLYMIPGRSRRSSRPDSPPASHLARQRRGRRDGWIHRLYERCRRRTPGARAVMDPFHVVHLAGDALDECRRRTGQERHHRRGRATDPLYKARRMLHTRSCLLTPLQQHQILDLFTSDCHVALEVTWSVYQNITWRIPRSQQNPQ